MNRKLSGWFHKIKRSISLKRWLFAVLILSTLIPIALIGAISYYSIYSIQEEKVGNGIQLNLQQEKAGLENTLKNIDYASTQLALNGKVGDKLIKLLKTDDIAEKYELSKEINENITLIYFTNQNLGIMLYFFPETSSVMFESLQVDVNFNLSALPKLTQYKGATFYGPHKSAYKVIKNQVFSVSRKLDIYPDECYIYLETNFELFEKLLSTKQYGLMVSHVLLDSEGKIIYSEKDDSFQTGTVFKAGNLKGGRESTGDYYIFREPSEQGWQLIAAVDKNEYNSAAYMWFSRFILYASVSLIISLIFALVIWKMVYRPLKLLNQEIGFVSRKKFDSKIRMTNIREFDDLLNHFRHMRQRILELLDDVEKKEKMKRRVDVEKLLHQINPHFLHNSLNSIQWLARMSGQDKIDRMVALLTQILHYNLGKGGGLVTVKEEIDNLQTYVELQRLRFDDELDVKIDADPEALELQLPRFIMQPLVENAIYHGLRDEQGHIAVKITLEEENMIITVEDDGEGLNEDQIELLLNGDSRTGEKVGLGIGLSYVNRMVKVHYGDDFGLHVRSRAGEGTVFTLKIPCRNE